MDDLRTRIAEAMDLIRTFTPLKPAIGIILGTGLGGLAKQIKKETVIEYSDIPHFPVSTVETHKGKLIFGTLAGKKSLQCRDDFINMKATRFNKLPFPCAL